MFNYYRYHLSDIGNIPTCTGIIIPVIYNIVVNNNGTVMYVCYIIMCNNSMVHAGIITMCNNNNNNNNNNNRGMYVCNITMCNNNNNCSTEIHQEHALNHKKIQFPSV